MESFRVEGLLASEHVYAEWDGSSVTASPDLLQLAELAVAVEEVFVEAGLAEGAWRRGRLREHEQLLLAVITCCDVLHRAECVVAGHRRALGPGGGW
jgi:hypothetical protein